MPSKNKIFVRKLAQTADSQNLIDIFSVFGEIIKTKVAVFESGETKGYGYVLMFSYVQFSLV